MAGRVAGLLPALAGQVERGLAVAVAQGRIGAEGEQPNDTAVPSVARGDSERVSPEGVDAVDWRAGRDEQVDGGEPLVVNGHHQ